MKNYQIIEKIYESTNSLVYRAILQTNNQPIIVKALKEKYPTPSELTRYKQEYEITRSLNVDNIIKAYDLQRHENSLIMFLEDFGGQSLNYLPSQDKLSLEEFLNIAIKITDALRLIHAANIIHKDINPSNIVYNRETEELKIIDFGISTRLSLEFTTVNPPNQLEGTLAYIAPEQTGRMNRGVDYRSDFYSLGVTFYELLTNKLPFETTDPMELVHCHIAQQPLPVHELIKHIPLAVSSIINKLLAKTPENRYQSALGIKADLENCLHQLNSLGEISQFSLGAQDITEKFQIPQKLYGREQEVTQLLTAFEKVSQGATEMLLISGYSGIGKSALVNEIYKPITRQRGHFISGKFEQLKRDIPYSAIAQAFQDLIRKLISESEIRLQSWKSKILDALGNNGQIIIDVIPEVEKIIGKQPPVEQLGATESQNRFNLIFQKFLSIFCQQEHPLVIFIDDLQWADLPSLNLIEQLILSYDNQYLLLIGAYRDNEVSSTHPLRHTLEKIHQAQVTINEISLNSLNTEHINQLLTDTLNCEAEIAKPLAELLAKKTDGNPFFLTQLLYSLYQENLIFFKQHQSFKAENNQKNYWQWNIEQIESVSITDNVVDLMVNKIEKLDKNTQQILKFASCVGSKFDLAILSIINDKSPIVTAKELYFAIEKGLIIPLNNNYKVPLLKIPENLSDNSSKNLAYYPKDITYKFLHDRVQQAAYSLIPETEKTKVHLKVGRLLLKNIKDDELQNEIFDIVNQLNEGSDLIIEQLEKNELAQLNLQAGQKAKSSTAYESALIYLKAGINLLSLESWEKQYDLTMQLHLESLESLYLNTNFTEIESFANNILPFSRNIADTVKIYQIQSLVHYGQFDSSKAIASTRKALAELNIDLPMQINEIGDSINQKQQRINLFLAKENIRDLASLPAMEDHNQLLIISILQSVVSPMITTNFPLFIWNVLTQLDLCLKYGNPPQASSIFSYYGMILCSASKDIDLGYKLGNLSIELLKQEKTSKFEALVIHIYYGLICHWKKSLRSLATEKKLLHGIRIGRDSGDNESTNYVAITFCLIQFFSSYDLSAVFDDYTKYLKLIHKTRQEYSIFYMKICRNIARNLIDEKYQLAGLVIGDSQEEDQYLKNWLDTNNEWLLFIFYFAKTIIYYLLKDYIHAYDCGLNAEKYVKSSGAYLSAPQHSFYSSLSFLAYYDQANAQLKNDLMEQVNKNQENFKLWTAHCPENFHHKYDLIAAEKARVLEQYWEATELYEKAIQGAKKYKFIHEEAIAYERAAEFHLENNRKEISQLYLRNAHHCYSQWGAKAKVKQLEEEYPEYLLGVSNQSKSTNLSTTISNTGTNGEILDLATIIKASQAISGEIKLEQLLQNLMKIVIENAGAQKGFLILKNQDNWVIEAQGTVDREQITILQSTSIEYTDPETLLPILPTTIINYVARSQEYLVINSATEEGQFINDPYILATECKSILCTPLLNQGQLRGIVYLENNLTTGAFTSERVELLNILSAQAAIAIDNSRLYQTLEQRVAERTQELSQTLNVLKATQAELIFENDLLRSAEQPSTFDYQVGGSLPMDSPTYVVRSADKNLYKSLTQGEFCYIFNARQMGKSSLMVRMINHLSHEGFHCVAIDMTRIGSENVTPEQWYKGFAVELWRSFGLLRKVKLKNWWNERKDISPVQRLSQFIEEVLLVEVVQEDDASPSNLVIFIDEIDCVLGLEFPVNDFFALIRFCYNQRNLNQEYKRLTFALLGVATPSDLIRDRKRTPFNIGRSIQLEGFKKHEAQPLLQGLTEKISNPQTILNELLAWTNGQPFLTQKLCQFIRSSSSEIPLNQEAEWIENLVQNNIIAHWESQDEPEHLRTIRDRILHSELGSTPLLDLYQQILDQGSVAAVDSSAEQELILSGLVAQKEGILRVNNRIYASIFNQSWIDQQRTSSS